MSDAEVLMNAVTPWLSAHLLQDQNPNQKAQSPDVLSAISSCIKPSVTTMTVSVHGGVDNIAIPCSNDRPEFAKVDLSLHCSEL